MSKCAEILAMTREEKEREIYKEFFFASDDYIADFQTDWGQIYNTIQDCNGDLNQVPELYLDLIIRWIYDNYEN